MNQFEWIHYVKLAEKLVESNDSNLEESYYRTSISRAYYGVFCILREMANLLDIREDAHKAVIDWYSNSNDTSIKYLGQKLDIMRKQRNRADYDLNIGNIKVSITKGAAERALLDANEILEILSLG